MRRAAYFELRSDYYGRPFDDGIIRALLDAGFAVDLFAPDGELPQTLYPATVRRLSVEYRRRWLQQNLLSKRWRDYDLFLGTADIPMAFAASLATVARKPFVTAADEIYVGGYEGAATAYWKRLSKWAMHNAAFTIITDVVRVPLQREYANLPESHEFFVMPSAYAFDLPAAPPADSFTISFTGAFTPYNGGDWAVRLLDAIPDARLLIQPGGSADPVLDALLARLPRATYLPQRLGFVESMHLTAPAHVGLVLYLSPQAQFQKMGISSQKLCTYLALGIPVVATRQESFEFIERYHCGVLISSEAELRDAVLKIRADRESYARNTKRAIDEYIRPVEKVRLLAERFRRV